VPPVGAPEEGSEHVRVQVKRAGRPLVLTGFLAESVESNVTVSAIPGSVFSMAFVRGQVTTVIDLGPFRGHLLVGRVRGEVVALSGLEVTGLEVTGLESTETAEPFDVAETFEALKSRIHTEPGFG
jgi:hypothetical protein